MELGSHFEGTSVNWTKNNRNKLKQGFGNSKRNLNLFEN
jgi:hypothetical protein